MQLLLNVLILNVRLLKGEKQKMKGDEKEKEWPFKSPGSHFSWGRDGGTGEADSALLE